MLQEQFLFPLHIHGKVRITLIEIVQPDPILLRALVLIFQQIIKRSRPVLRSCRL